MSSTLGAMNQVFFEDQEQEKQDSMTKTDYKGEKRFAKEFFLLAAVIAIPAIAANVFGLSIGLAVFSSVALYGFARVVLAIANEKSPQQNTFWRTRAQQASKHEISHTTHNPMHSARLSTDPKEALAQGRTEFPSTVLAMPQETNRESRPG